MNKGKVLRTSVALNQLSELQKLIGDIKNKISGLPMWLSEIQIMSLELEKNIVQARTNTKIARKIAERSAQDLKERISDTAR